MERVKRSLRGTDCYLLVANSRGVNVWCAATGGLLTNHDVVSVLKTSGIEKLVDHRRVILPQLAATGIQGKVVQKKTGWRVVWGPVEARALPAFVDAGLEAPRALRSVAFPWRERLEMAIAWACPMSVLGALLSLPFWREGMLAVAGLTWALSLLIFASFPLYERLLRSGRWAVPLLFWGVVTACLAAVAGLGGAPDWGFVLRWSLVSLAVVLILGVDLMGSTPVYKSGLHDDRLLAIELDPERCKGAGFCEQVCPKDVFVVDAERRLASLPRAGHCVQCGACVVQCPFDALYFESPSGEIVPPETLRRFKLNLMGHRLVRTGDDAGSGPA